MLFNKSIIYICILYTTYIQLCFSTTVSVNSSENFLNYFSSNDNDDTAVLTINGLISLNTGSVVTLTNSINKLQIKGKNEESELTINNGIIFSENIKEIEFTNININGHIYFKNNESIKFKGVDHYGSIEFVLQDGYNGELSLSNSNYHGQSNGNHNCIYIKNGNLVIENSRLYGHSSCTSKLINITGSGESLINVTNSTLSGEHSTSLFKITNTNIKSKNSNFVNFTSIEGLSGGGFSIVDTELCEFQNCSFQNGYSTERGTVFYLFNVKKFVGNDLLVKNTQTYNEGILFYEECLNDFTTTIILENITEEDMITDTEDGKGLIIMNRGGPLYLDLKHYYGRNSTSFLNEGTLFMLLTESYLTVENVRFEDYYSKADGYSSFLYHCNSACIGKITVNYCDFRNLYINADHSVTLFGWNGVTASISNCYAKDVYGDIVGLVYNTGTVTMQNITVENFYSVRNIGLIDDDPGLEKNQLILKDIHLRNITYKGDLVRTTRGTVTIENSEFIYSLDKRPENNVESYPIFNKLIDDDGGLFTLKKENSSLTIKNSSFENFYKYYGVNSKKLITQTFEKVNYNNCFFLKSLHTIEYNKNKMPEILSDGKIKYTSSVFNNTYGDRGSIVSVFTDNYSDFQFEFSKCTFSNNYANYGGIVYSLNLNASNTIKFNKCDFIDNSADIGPVSFSADQRSIPYFSNYNTLLSSNAINTNPTKIKKDTSVPLRLSMYSGDFIPEDIIFKIYNDFDSELYFHRSREEVEGNIDNIPFYSVEINDTYNARLYGEKVNNCILDSCILSKLRVIGNPGVYKLLFTLETFGKYNSFSDNMSDVEVEILPCDTNDGKHILREESNIHLQTCYIPRCEPMCVHGVCINENACNCTGTYYVGQLCNERVKSKSYTMANNIIGLVSIILTVFSVGLMFGAYYLRDNKFVKGGGFEFLIVILVGTILSYIYSVFSLFRRTHAICFLLEILKSLSFSLIYATILIKILRIYVIYHHPRHLVIPRGFMYAFIGFIALFHIILSISELIVSDSLSEIKLNAKYEEYKECVYPKIHFLGYLLDIMIIMIGGALAYLNRNTEKIYNEKLSIPIYTYILCFVVLRIVDSYKVDINVKVYVEAFGILIYTSTIIYYVYFRRANKIAREKKPLSNNKILVM